MLHIATNLVNNAVYLLIFEKSLIKCVYVLLTVAWKLPWGCLTWQAVSSLLELIDAAGRR